MESRDLISSTSCFSCSWCWQFAHFLEVLQCKLYWFLPIPIHGLGLDSIGVLSQFPVFYLLYLLAFSPHCSSSFCGFMPFKNSYTLVAFLVREKYVLNLPSQSRNKLLLYCLVRTCTFHLIPAIKFPLCRLNIGWGLLASNKLSKSQIRWVIKIRNRDASAQVISTLTSSN